MRNVCVAITLEYIINTVDIKQTDSPGYWPIKDSNCVRVKGLMFLKDNLFFN